MVSSFSTRKRLEKQNPGENSNTWGGYLNTNTIDMIDECFGLVCVAMTTAGDSILTTQNGATDQGRRSQIVLTGAPTSNVSLFVPAVQSFYLVRNKMTGANKVTLKNAGGINGVDFSGTGSGAEQGLVLSDGTHVREIFRTVSVGAFSAFTSAVYAAVSNVALDATGGADADLILFHDASENGALNHVAVSTFMKNTIANAPARTSASPSDTLLVGNSDASFAAANATLQMVHNSQFGLTAKTTLVAADTVGITDSAASNAAKKITVTNLVGAICSLGAASQADQETGTTGNKLVTPAVQHHHDSAAKCWAFVSGGTTTSQLGDSFNVDSIADTSLGHVTFTIGTDFSSAKWCCQFTTELNYNAGTGSEISGVDDGGMAAGTVRGRNRTSGQSTEGGFTDPNSWHMVGFGDQ